MASCGCEDARLVLLRPAQYMQVKGDIENLRKTYGLEARPHVDAAFYYDFAMRGILAAA